jgi:two-component system response regulator NreC
MLGGVVAHPGKTTVVLADDHAVVRRGLRTLVEAEAGMRVLAEAANVADAERLTSLHAPHVLVIDLNMPGGSVLEAIPRLREQSPDVGIVVLTMQDDPAFARQALQAGALGFVLKESAEEELLQAIRNAAVGDTYLNPRLGARIAAEPAARRGPADGLSEHEVALLRLLALGHTTAEIAAQLYLSPRTVETHRAQVQHKLRIGSRAELVRYALDHGLLDHA